MTFDFEQFKIDQRIDPGALDVAANQQATLFSNYVFGAVDARADADRAKALLDTTEARLSLAIRKDPESYGIDGRATEGAIEQTVLVHPEFLESLDKMLKAKELSAVWDGAVSVMETRKRMIESQITLHGQHYFAGPAVPRDLVAQVQQLTDKTSEVTSRQLAKARRAKEKT